MRVLAWPAQPQDDEVVLREDGVDELGNDRFVVADDSWKQCRPGTKLRDQVVAKLPLDAAMGHLTGVDTPTQIAQDSRPQHALDLT